MRPRSLRSEARCALALSLATLASCAAVGPDYEPPKATVPESWSRTQSAELAREAELERWWEAFDDPELASLIERARAHNLDLAVAETRVREARAALGVAHSAELPSLDANASYARTRQSLDSRGGAPLFGQRENDLYSVGFDANWEIDVFGGIRRSVEAARAEWQQVEELRSATMTSLVAEVARSYVELRGLQRRLAVALGRVDNQRELSEIVGARARAGVASDLDSSRADAQLSSLKAEVPALRALVAERVHALGILLAEEPRALESELAGGDTIPAANAALALGQPLELLRHRPDVRAAERACAASSARLGVAIAQRYPRVSLGATFGWIANDSGDLFQSSSMAAGILPSISLPLFDAGLRKSVVEEASAREDATVLTYQQTVLGAAKEVEDALAGVAGASERRAELRTAVDAQTRASTLARDLYASGVVDFLTVLDADRELFDLQDQLVRSEAETSIQFVALAKALGGGWEGHDPAIAADRPTP